MAGDLEQEEKLINTDKIYEFLYDYKIPLIFTIIAIFLIGGAIILYRANNQSPDISFSSDETVSEKIKADIEGEVVKPGVYELTSNSRVQDLLILAGGLTADADREWVGKSLNQAAKVTDGAKIYIPAVSNVKSAETGSGSLEAGNKLISINSATLNELDTLSGIGPVTAQKIIDKRPYQTLEELVSKKAVSQSIFDKIKEKISLY